MFVFLSWVQLWRHCPEEDLNELESRNLNARMAVALRNVSSHLLGTTENLNEDGCLHCEKNWRQRVKFNESNES